MKTRVSMKDLMAHFEKGSWNFKYHGHKVSVINQGMEIEGYPNVIVTGPFVSAFHTYNSLEEFVDNAGKYRGAK